MAGSSKSLKLDTPDDFLKVIKQVLLQSHTAAVLVMATRLDVKLEELLKTRMPNLSNKLQKKLFESFGPFSSLSAKIDVTYSMKLISSDLHRDLHAIRDIRNAFAHTYEKLSFDDEEIIKLVDKLSAPNGASELPKDRFVSVYKNCRREIISSTAGPGDECIQRASQ